MSLLELDFEKATTPNIDDRSRFYVGFGHTFDARAYPKRFNLNPNDLTKVSLIDSAVAQLQYGEWLEISHFEFE